MQLAGRIPSFFLLFISLILMAGDGYARTLNVCIVNRDHQPFSALDLEAQGQRWVRSAIEGVHDQVVFHPVPWSRCVLGVRKGDYDASLGVAFNEEFLPEVVYPAKKGRVDTTRSLGSLSFVVVGRVGGGASWDGANFYGQTQPVLYNSGIVAVANKLASLDVPRSDGPKQPLDLLRMLLLDRAELGVVQLNSLNEVWSDDEFKGKFKIMNAPFLEIPLYIGVNRAIYERDPAYFDALWDHIGRMRANNK